MAYSAKAVANYLLGVAESGGKTIDPMQMQKLVYFAHGWHLALRNGPLIRETVEAWDYGPVVAELYHGLKQFGASPIRTPIIDLSLVGTKFTAIQPVIDAQTVDESDAREAKALISRVWDVYGKFSALQLSAMTHAPEGPWKKTRDANPGRKNVDIPDPLIREHFLAQASRSRAAHAGTV